MVNLTPEFQSNPSASRSLVETVSCSGRAIAQFKASNAQQSNTRSVKAWGLLLLLMAVCSTGCSTYGGVGNYWAYNSKVDDYVTGWRDYVWARRAYYQRQGRLDCGAHEKAFKAGFMAGYRNVCQGGGGCVPAIPPRQYWGWQYQSAEGQAKVAAWFAAYPHGARAAEEDGAGAFNQIQVSSQIEAAIQQQTPHNPPPALEEIGHWPQNPAQQRKMAPFPLFHEYRQAHMMPPPDDTNQNKTIPVAHYAPIQNEQVVAKPSSPPVHPGARLERLPVTSQAGELVAASYEVPLKPTPDTNQASQPSQVPPQPPTESGRASKDREHSQNPRTDS